MKKKLTKKQQELLYKKDLIFRTAIKLFQKYGYDNVSIKDICNETGISSGSLYNIYENKATILHQFKDSYIEKCYTALCSNLNPENGIQTIIDYIMSLLEAFNYIGADMTLQLHISHNILFPSNSKGSKILEGYIDSLKKNNTLKTTLPSSQCVDMINIIVYGFVYHWCMNENDVNLIENAKTNLPEMLTFLK